MQQDGLHGDGAQVSRQSHPGSWLQEYISSPDGKANRDSLVQATKAQFPQYWEELLGIAEGSGIPEDLVHLHPVTKEAHTACQLNLTRLMPWQIVVLNLRQELSILADAGNDTAGADDCSDVMLKFSDGDKYVALLGHNEDNTVDTVNTTYFVQAKLVRNMPSAHSGSMSAIACALFQHSVQSGWYDSCR